MNHLNECMDCKMHFLINTDERGDDNRLIPNCPNCSGPISALRRRWDKQEDHQRAERERVIAAKLKRQKEKRGFSTAFDPSSQSEEEKGRSRNTQSWIFFALPLTRGNCKVYGLPIGYAGGIILYLNSILATCCYTLLAVAGTPPVVNHSLRFGVWLIFKKWQC